MCGSHALTHTTHAGLSALVQRERQERLAAAQAQVAYDAEVAALKLSKLQTYFDSTPAEHVVVVHALGDAAVDAGAGVKKSDSSSSSSRKSVCTFRPPELPREVEVSQWQLGKGASCWVAAMCAQHDGGITVVGMTKAAIQLSDGEVDA